MLNAIVRFSIRYRGIVVALGCAFLAYGVFFGLSRAVQRLPGLRSAGSRDSDRGAGALLRTGGDPRHSTHRKLQSMASPGSTSLRSKSIQGLSVITVVFRFGTDIYRDRQAVSERLSTVAGELPERRSASTDDSADNHHKLGDARRLDIRQAVADGVADRCRLDGQAAPAGRSRRGRGRGQRR